MADIIEKLIVQLGLDFLGYKKGMTEVEKLNDRLNAKINGQNKKEAEEKIKTSEKVTEVQTENVEKVIKTHEKSADAIASLGRKYLGFYGIMKAGQAIYRETVKIATEQKDLGYLSDNVGISAKRLDAWGKAAESAGGSISGMQEQIRLASAQVQQAKFGQLDQSGLNFLLWGGSDQHGEFKNTESLLKAKIKLIQDLFAKYGDRAQTVYAASQFGAGEDLVNMALQPGGQGAINAKIAELEGLSAQSPNASAGAKERAANLTKAGQAVESAAAPLVEMGNGIIDFSVNKILVPMADAIKTGAVRGWTREKLNWLILKYGKESEEYDKKMGNSPGTTLATSAMESSGNPNAISNKGAIGLTGLMPETAKAEAKEMGEVWNPKDSSQNLRISAHYRAKMNKQTGDTLSGAAAYNGGKARLDKVGGLPGSSADVQQYARDSAAIQSQIQAIYANTINVNMPPGTDAQGIKRELPGLITNNTKTMLDAGGGQ